MHRIPDGIPITPGGLSGYIGSLRQHIRGARVSPVVLWFHPRTTERGGRV